MTAITHHPDDSTLMSYAAGALPGVLAVAVAAHADVCPACAAELRDLQSLGAVLVSDLPSTALERSVPQMALRALEADVAEARAERETGSDVPVPLQTLIGSRLDDIRWRRLGLNVWHLPIKMPQVAEGDLRLLRVGPGQAMPQHGHGGSELTLILSGAYRDEFGTYRAGDLADLGEDAVHRPVADERDGCICLIASEKRAQFKGLFGRLIQPLTGI